MGYIFCSRRGPEKNNILTSALVDMKYGGQAKILFVRDRRKGDWLALLTIGIQLLDEDLVCIYGKPWDIKVFFKMSKQHLDLERGPNQFF